MGKMMVLLLLFQGTSLFIGDVLGRFILLPEWTEHVIVIAVAIGYTILISRYKCFIQITRNERRVMEYQSGQYRRNYE